MIIHPFGPSGAAGESQIGGGGGGRRIEPGEHYPDGSLRTLCSFALEDIPLGILSRSK